MHWPLCLVSLTVIGCLSIPSRSEAVALGDVPFQPTLSYTFAHDSYSRNNYFGTSVAVNDTWALIGGLNGDAKLFNLNDGTLRATLKDPTPAGNNRFGISVALGNDILAIGDHYADTGQVHVFDTSGMLIRTLDDPTPTGHDQFGASISVSGNHILVGAPRDATLGEEVGQAHLFNLENGQLIRTFNDPEVTDHSFFGTISSLGSSVAIGDNDIFVGAPADISNLSRGMGIGVVNRFDFETGNLSQTFDNPPPNNQGGFGASIAIDNGVLAVADRTSQEVHLYDTTTNNLLVTLHDPDPDPTCNPLSCGGGSRSFGSAIAMKDNHLLVADLDPTDNITQVHLYDTSGNLLFTLRDPVANGLDRYGNLDDWFGSSVAISDNYVLIGDSFEPSNGNNSGSAYLFTFDLPQQSPTVEELVSDAVTVTSGEVDWNNFKSSYGLPELYPQSFHDFFENLQIPLLETGIGATFTPNLNYTLQEAADALGYDHFNWYSLIYAPPESETGRVDPTGNCNEGVAFVTGYLCPNRDDFLWYLDERYSVDGQLVYDENGARATLDELLQSRREAWTVAPDTLLFSDAPNVRARFTTCLAGVYADGTGDVINLPSTCFNWLQPEDGFGFLPILVEDAGGGTSSSPVFLGFVEPGGLTDEQKARIFEAGLGIVQPVPEPSGIALFGVALLLLVGRTCKRILALDCVSRV